MSSTYPTTIDAFNNPAGTTQLSDPSYLHNQQHGDANDAIEGLEAKVGVGAGTPKANYALIGSGNGTSVWGTAWNNANLGTPAITAGTITNMQLIGTSQITGGTHNTGVFGTPTFVYGSDAAGDLMYRSAAGTETRLAIGASGYYLTTDGTTPSWGSVQTQAEQNDGWITAGGTWSYSSGSVVTINTDLTSWMQRGDKIKFTQGGTVEYFNLLGFGVASGTTTGTILGDVGTPVTNTAISSPSFSKKVNPKSWPYSFNYTVTFTKPTGMTTTLGTIHAVYQVYGNWARANIGWSQTSSSGTSDKAYFASLPFTAIDIGNNSRYVGAAVLERSGPAAAYLVFSNLGSVKLLYSGTIPVSDEEFNIDIWYPYA